MMQKSLIFRIWPNMIVYKRLHMWKNRRSKNKRKTSVSHTLTPFLLLNFLPKHRSQKTSSFQEEKKSNMWNKECFLLLSFRCLHVMWGKKRVFSSLSFQKKQYYKHLTLIFFILKSTLPFFFLHSFFLCTKPTKPFCYLIHFSLFTSFSFWFSSSQPLLTAQHLEITSFFPLDSDSCFPC